MIKPKQIVLLIVACVIILPCGYAIGYTFGAGGTVLSVFVGVMGGRWAILEGER